MTKTSLLISLMIAGLSVVSGESGCGQFNSSCSLCVGGEISGCYYYQSESRSFCFYEKVPTEEIEQFDEDNKISKTTQDCQDNGNPGMTTIIPAGSGFDVDNKTTTEKPTTTPPANTTTTPTPTPTPTPPSNTTTTPTPTPANSTTTSLPPTTTTTNGTSTTSTPVPSTTSAPVTPSPRSNFDGWSFFGGIILTVCFMAIGFVGLKYYRVRRNADGNYNRF